MSRPTRLLGLRARATLAWALIALVLSGALAGFAYQVTRNQLVSERETNILNQVFLNARFVRGAIQTGEPDMAEALSAVVGSSESAQLARVGGEWFSGSVGTGPGAIPSGLSELVSSTGAARQLVELDGRPVVSIGVAIPAYRASYFELIPVEDIDRTLDGLARGLALTAALATVIGAAMGWLATGRVLRPLNQFTLAAERIAQGSLDTRLSTGGDRDLRVLARSFNRMADSVQQRIDREARFTSQVTHELRSPVAALFSSINVARRKRTPRDTGQVLDDMEGRVGDLHRLVEDLLELSRVEAGVSGMQIEPVEPVEVIKALLERTGCSDIPIHVAEGVPESIRADKRRLAQMLQNLIDNAQRYAGGATRVEVTGGDGVIRFVVEDEGAGVAEHERLFIFERFARGDAASRSGISGAGLGLSLVLEHAALHGGKVTYEDREGGGSRFIIELPVGGPS